MDLKKDQWVLKLGGGAFGYTVGVNEKKNIVPASEAIINLPEAEAYTESKKILRGMRAYLAGENKVIAFPLRDVFEYPELVPDLATLRAMMYEFKDADDIKAEASIANKIFGYLTEPYLDRINELERLIAAYEETKCAQCDNPAAPDDTLCKSCSDKVDLVCELNDG